MNGSPLSAVAITDEEYLDQARWICKRVPTLRFEVGFRFDHKAQRAVPTYRVYRRGMGLVAERSSLSAMVAYLRKQLPT